MRQQRASSDPEFHRHSRPLAIPQVDQTRQPLRVLGHRALEAWLVLSLSGPQFHPTLYAFAERTIIVSEYVGCSLNERQVTDSGSILRIFYQVANGLSRIDELGFAAQNLEPRNVLVSGDGNVNVKLYNYGMFHQTNQGEYVAFPIG